MSISRPRSQRRHMNLNCATVRGTKRLARRFDGVRVSVIRAVTPTSGDNETAVQGDAFADAAVSDLAAQAVVEMHPDVDGEAHSARFRAIAKEFRGVTRVHEGSLKFNPFKSQVIPDSVG